MACGFGAVTLLFLILKHDAGAAIANNNSASQAEASLLAEDIRVGEQNRVKLRNSLQEITDQLATTQGLSNRVLDELEQSRRELSVQSSPDKKIALLQRQVEELETARLQEQGSSTDTRQFVGNDQRQYLTGLKLGGRRVMILLDASASMLAESIVNVVRRRNMSDSAKRKSPKWQRAVRTVEWLVSQLPLNSQYQIHTFNTVASPLSPGTSGQWLAASDSATLDAAITNLKKLSPDGGTSLYKAFNAIGGFSLRPDNIFLITDGLPTQGRGKPSKTTISGKARVNLFNEALEELPRGIPVNTILLPMEGDPAAAALFWRLALTSRGAFLSPSRDWP
jgi:hypothetical protein